MPDVSPSPVERVPIAADSGSGVSAAIERASHVSTGSTPGIGVIRVLEGGRHGAFEAIARVTNVDAAGVERADVHALSIRLK